MSGAALQLRGVTKSFGHHRVLDGVDLDVEAGSLTAVLGPSGGGKTTLLRVIAGFLRPDEGTVELDGALVAAPRSWQPPERRRIGIVPQEGALFPHLSVGANVGYGLRRNIGRAARAGRVAECLELVGLAGSERARPHELSGGQQQRVALARALAPRPTMVVLDEPFSALDAGLRARVRADVVAALRHAGATGMLVTHDQQEALSTADQVAVLLDGRILQVGDPETVYRAPADLAVANFVGHAITLTSRVQPSNGHRADSPLGAVELMAPTPCAGVVVLVIRPEQVRIGSATGTVHARVVSSTFLGNDAVVELEVVGVAGTVPARVRASELPQVGSKVGISIAGPVHSLPCEP
jgi:iron(III) transport system ATP-binding protein